MFKNEVKVQIPHEKQTNKFSEKFKTTIILPAFGGFVYLHDIQAKKWKFYCTSSLAIKHVVVPEDSFDVDGKAAGMTSLANNTFVIACPSFLPTVENNPFDFLIFFFLSVMANLSRRIEGIDKPAIYKSLSQNDDMTFKGKKLSKYKRIF